MVIEMSRRYSELIKLKTFEERFEYLRCDGIVADPTFGGLRWANQRFYQRSKEWERLRRDIIVRDNGCDLAMPDRIIGSKIYIHHIEPLTIEDITNMTSKVLDPENLICTSFQTHQAIHYGNINSIVPSKFVERGPNDTCPWKR